MKEYDFDFPMMGSDASVSIVAPAEGIAETAYRRLRRIAEIEEARYSRFKDESELSRLNRERTLQVSVPFMETLLLARDLWQRTEGAFNPLVNISRFGYDADISLVKGRERSPSANKNSYTTDFDAVRIDETQRVVSLAEGQHLDFDGFLKWRVAHQMADAAHLCAGVVVNVGGDIYTRGVDADGMPFSFSLDNPCSPLDELSYIARDVGVATSGTYKRHWTLDGKPFHHILDGSGKKNSDSDVVSATVIAPTGAEADAFATIPMVLGSVAGARMLKNFSCAYFLICKDGSFVTSPGFLAPVATHPVHAH